MILHKRSLIANNSNLITMVIVMMMFMVEVLMEPLVSQVPAN